MLPGNWVYDTASFQKLANEKKKKETDSKKEDLVAEPVIKSTFPRNKKRRQHVLTTEKKLNESNEDQQQTPNDTQTMLTTQNLLLDEAKTPVDNKTSFNDNQSSIIIDELSNSYSDGLDDDNDSEVDIKIYDKPEEKQMKHQE